MAEQRKATRYAQAILEAVLEQWQTVLSQISDALARDPGLLARLEGGNLDLDAKMKELDQIIPENTSPEARNFLKLLVQEGDLEMIPAVEDELQTSISGGRQPLKAEVVSAVELSDERKAALREQLAAQHGKGLVFSFRVDPSLLGGLRVRVGDKLIDHSVASRLSAMRDVFNTAGQ